MILKTVGFRSLMGKFLIKKVLKGNREIAKWKYRLRGNIFRSFFKIMVCLNDVRKSLVKNRDSGGKKYNCKNKNR